MTVYKLQVLSNLFVPAGFGSSEALGELGQPVLQRFALLPCHLVLVLKGLQ